MKIGDAYCLRSKTKKRNIFFRERRKRKGFFEFNSKLENRAASPIVGPPYFVPFSSIRFSFIRTTSCTRGNCNAQRDFERVALLPLGASVPLYARKYLPFTHPITERLGRSGREDSRYGKSRYLPDSLKIHSIS